MSASPFPPTGFSWLLPAFRPSRREVRAYADAIRAADQDHGRKERSPLRQAELQLWVWRMETRQPTRTTS